MAKQFSRFILKLFGWQVIGSMPEGIKKCVVIVAPHTSYWDFVIGYMAYKALGVKARYLIKKELFFFPLGPLLRNLGGIPVDRSHSSNVVQQVGQLFRKNDNLIVTITPEGTRSLVTNWKRGFYYIAKHAKVPILIGILDYGKKEIGIINVFRPTGKYQKDLIEIQSNYLDVTAKHPEKFNLSPQNRNE
jgi:1-acyl-sn-glycerol-3-phosphate acyltransferase